VCIFGENPNPLGVQFLYLALLGFERKYPLHRFHEINLLLLIIKIFIYSSVLFYLNRSLTNILHRGRMGPLADIHCFHGFTHFVSYYRNKRLDLEFTLGKECQPLSQGKYVA
jgi:hypothetical protein